MRVSYCGKTLRTAAAGGFGDGPAWDELLCFGALSDDALRRAGLEPRLPFQGARVEVWERGLLGRDSLVGGFEADPSLLGFNERRPPAWGRLAHASRPASAAGAAGGERRRHFGSVRCFCLRGLGPTRIKFLPVQTDQ